METKESFIAIAKLIDFYKKDYKFINILDFGCAAGHFTNYLSCIFPDDSIVGHDYSAELIETARSNFPNIKFFESNILDRASAQMNSFDVITCCGVLSIFDDIEPAISNLSHWIKPNGRIYIHGLFNPYDVDVYIKYTLPGISRSMEPGWNIFSKKTYNELLLKYGAKKMQYHDFSLKIDLPKQADPTRSWTELMSDGTRQITNGLSIKQHQMILEVFF